MWGTLQMHTLHIVAMKYNTGILFFWLYVFFWVGPWKYGSKFFKLCIWCNYSPSNLTLSFWNIFAGENKQQWCESSLRTISPRKMWLRVPPHRFAAGWRRAGCCWPPACTRCRVGKIPVFFYETQPSVFFFYICPDERVFRVFFSFKNTFRCIQTLNYNHSY